MIMHERTRLEVCPRSRQCGLRSVCEVQVNQVFPTLCIVIKIAVPMSKVLGLSTRS